jgi:hypothetical protein
MEITDQMPDSLYEGGKGYTLPVQTAGVRIPFTLRGTSTRLLLVLYLIQYDVEKSY